MDSLREYQYDLWHTINAWIQLHSGMYMYILDFSLPEGLLKHY